MDSPDGFPVAGLAITSPDPDDVIPSPSDSGLSLDDLTNYKTGPHAISEEQFVGHRGVTRPIAHGAPAEQRLVAANGKINTDVQKQRLHYFEEAFAYRESGGSARDRILKDTPITADLRTNVIVEDEHTLVTSLSHQLSTRYQRPESSIIISLVHSACICLAGSFEPAYILTVVALPVQLQSTTNKRNAASITDFLTEILKVQPERGLIRFQPITEENLAIDGATVLGEIERLERHQTEENGRLLKRKKSDRSRISFTRKSLTKARSNGTIRDKEAAAAATHYEDHAWPPLPAQSPLASPSLTAEDRPLRTNFHYPVRPPARKQFEPEGRMG